MEAITVRTDLLVRDYVSDIDKLIDKFLSGDCGQKQLRYFIKENDVLLVKYLLVSLSLKIGHVNGGDRTERLSNAITFGYYFANKFHNLNVR